MSGLTSVESTRLPFAVFGAAQDFTAACFALIERALSAKSRRCSLGKAVAQRLSEAGAVGASLERGVRRCCAHDSLV